MIEKENARRAWKTERAHVRKHISSIARDPEWWTLTRTDELRLGALFTAAGLLIVLLGAVA